MRILCDVDGVIADLHTEWLRRYNADYNDTLTQDQVTAWEIHRFVSQSCGSRIYDYLRAPDLYAHVPVIHDALWGVTILRQRGHRVVFVTSNVKGMLDQKWTWLECQGFLPPGPTAADLISATDKSFVAADVAIDDYAENLRTSLAYRRVLLSQPWNRDARGDWQRVYSWEQIVDEIASLEVAGARMGG